MRWLGKITALVLLALWVPVTAHCSLERLTASALLACCCEGETDPAPEPDCEQQVCSVLEAGLVKQEDGRICVLLPDASEHRPLISSEPTALSLLPSCLPPANRRPLPSAWPRWLRTVQPLRGPTVLS